MNIDNYGYVNQPFRKVKKHGLLPLTDKSLVR